MSGSGSSEFGLRKFIVPEFIFGDGARNLAGGYARNFGARKVLLVTDHGLADSDWVMDVTASLRDAGLSSVVYSDVSPNPRATEVMLGAELYHDEGCNVIVVVGGGSPIDCAKGIGVVTANKRHILEFEGVDMVKVPMPPLICVPTTCGSSADVSQFAIISNIQKGFKIAIISKTVVPDLSLIDPVVLTTLSDRMRISSSIDALCHGVEAYLSLASSPVTDLHALEAVRVVSSNLVDLHLNPEDPEIRSRMMLGSLYAGMAFSNASLGATHAMAHSLGGLIDIPHGECNAILLEHVIAYNSRSVPERMYGLARAMGSPAERGMSPDELIGLIGERIGRLKREVGFRLSLSDVGVRREHIPMLARNALLDPCMVTNPRRPNQREIEEIYERAL